MIQIILCIVFASSTSFAGLGDKQSDGVMSSSLTKKLSSDASRLQAVVVEGEEDEEGIVGSTSVSVPVQSAVISVDDDPLKIQLPEYDPNRLKQLIRTGDVESIENWIASKKISENETITVSLESEEDDDEEGDDSAESEHYFCSILIYAVHMNQSGVVQSLLNHGADLNQIDSERQTVFQIAASRGFLGIMQILLDTKKIDLWHRDPVLKMTALHFAAENSAVDAVKWILGVSAKTIGVPETQKCIQWKDHLGRSAIHYAVVARSSKMITLFAQFLESHQIQNGLDDTDNQKKTSLHLAIIGMDRDMVQTLLGFGARGDRPDEAGDTAIEKVVSMNRVEMLRLFTDYYEFTKEKLDELVEVAKKHSANEALAVLNECLFQLC